MRLYLGLGLLIASTYSYIVSDHINITIDNKPVAKLPVLFPVKILYLCSLIGSLALIRDGLTQ
jgi:hypothetical protein